MKIRMATDEHRKAGLRAGMSVKATVRTDLARSANPHPTIVEGLLAALDLLPRSRCYQ